VTAGDGLVHQNFSEDFLLDPVLAARVALPAGEVAEPFIDADDIAEGGGRALTEDGTPAQLYELTGPRLLTFADAVGEIAAGPAGPGRKQFNESSWHLELGPAPSSHGAFGLLTWALVSSTFDRLSGGPRYEPETVATGGQLDDGWPATCAEHRLSPSRRASIRPRADAFMRRLPARLAVTSLRRFEVHR